MDHSMQHEHKKYDLAMTKGQYEHFSPFALFFIAATTMKLIFFLYLNIKGYIADEGFHAGMVDAFLRGQWDNLPTSVTTPPYFHAALAFLTHISGVKEMYLEAMRASQMLLSIGAIPCFYLIAKELRHVNCDMRMLMCLYLPIYLPLFNLVYTDPPSVTFTALMLLLTLKKYYWLAALAALLGLAVRQMTIIWAFFCTAYIVFDFIDNRYGKISHKLFLKFFWSNLKGTWPKVTPFLVPASAFIIFIIYNKGIVAGDKEAHPTSFNLANLFCFLIASFILFLPYQLEKFNENIETIKNKKWLWYAIPIYFTIYLIFHKITHDYNKPSMDWWVHNQILIVSSTNAFYKVLFFAPILWATLTYWNIAKQSEKPWKMYLLYACGSLSFVPLPLVELRYYTISIIFFILLKPKLSDISEKATLVSLALISFYMIFCISQRLLFI